jgi:hypothetical protein
MHPDYKEDAVAIHGYTVNQLQEIYACRDALNAREDLKTGHHQVYLLDDYPASLR